MEGDLVATAISTMVSTFQSTPSAWRETGCGTSISGFRNISIHSLRMEGDLHLVKVSLYGRLISIHSLRMEGDKLVGFFLP